MCVVVIIIVNMASTPTVYIVVSDVLCSVQHGGCFMICSAVCSMMGVSRRLGNVCQCVGGLLGIVHMH